MQGNWQNMVQQREVMPPEGVWDAIALALHKAEQKPDWQNRIYNATVEPPVHSWQQIAAQLDAAPASQAGWQERIYQYEAVPPAEAWQAVAEMLDKQAANTEWDARLYNHQVEPPAAVWAYITAQLNTDIAPVVSISQKPVRNKSIFRIAAAAIVLLGLAGTALWTMRERFFGESSQSVAVNTNAPTAQPPVANTTTPIAGNDNIAQTNTIAEANTTPPNNAIAVKNKGKKRPSASRSNTTIAPLEYVTHNEMAFLPTDAVFTNTNKLPNERGQTVVEINGMDAPNSSYINISGPDGQSIRVSAKFANLLGYLNDGPDQEERLDRIIKESAFWKATFRQWREKMTDADAAPSLSNFMGLLEMVKVLQ
jgi:hypothetical protein